MSRITVSGGISIVQRGDRVDVRCSCGSAVIHWHSALDLLAGIVLGMGLAAVAIAAGYMLGSVSWA